MLFVSSFCCNERVLSKLKKRSIPQQEIPDTKQRLNTKGDEISNISYFRAEPHAVGQSCLTSSSCIGSFTTVISLLSVQDLPLSCTMWKASTCNIQNCHTALTKLFTIRIACPISSVGQYRLHLKSCSERAVLYKIKPVINHATTNTVYCRD